MRAGHGESEPPPSRAGEGGSYHRLLTVATRNVTLCRSRGPVSAGEVTTLWKRAGKASGLTNARHFNVLDEQVTNSFAFIQDLDRSAIGCRQELMAVDAQTVQNCERDIRGSDGFRSHISAFFIR